MRRISGAAYRRRKMIMMIAGSALVLTAITATGIFAYRNQILGRQNENIVDFSVLEDSQEEAAQTQNRDVQNFTGKEDPGELDYDPYYAAKDELLNRTEPVPQKKAAAEVTDSGDSQGPAVAEMQQTEEETSLEVGYGEYTGEETSVRVIADAEVANAMAEERNLHFDENSRLAWPVVGNVVLNYSMDKTVYFQTLQQYKYNPSIVISAVTGANIACAADGVVRSVYRDPQTGGTVVMKLGNGYELTYGQLTDICVEEGEFVEQGVFIGQVAAPTKYYSKEGTNVYFKLTRDQEPVNPLDYLG